PKVYRHCQDREGRRQSMGEKVVVPLPQKRKRSIFYYTINCAISRRSLFSTLFKSIKIDVELLKAIAFAVRSVIGLCIELDI
ncbi:MULTISPECIES: hypothetical protein, partial [Spirulina sp. CCY15215]|uniref:hypothetical protein n=1 Tax=Spirulina sp. CCY15215 TaxID=2767591 RepID=UPI00194F2533